MYKEYGTTLPEDQEQQYESSVSLARVHNPEKFDLGVGRELPRWQTQPVNVIEDVMSRWIDSITNEEAYKGVQDRLNYLRAWLSRLQGINLKNAQIAIRLLEERKIEYEKRNLKAYISKIASLVRDPIKDDTTFNIALDYYKALVEMRPKLRGTWAQGLSQPYLDPRTDGSRGSFRACL